MTNPVHVAPPVCAAMVTPRWRWFAIAVASLLAHALALDLIPHWTLDASAPARSEPLRARLVAVPDPLPALQPEMKPSLAPAPAQAPKPVPAGTSARPKRESFPKKAPKPLSEPLDPTVDAITITPADVKAAEAATTAPAASAAAPGPASPDAAAPDAALPVPAAPPPLATDPPASALLRYTVVANDMKSGTAMRYYGVGSLKWTIEGPRYSADLEASIPLLLFKLKVLASHSEGTLDATGLLPGRYTETPRNRSTLATNFNRDERRSISFSASQASLPLVEGAQDRLSVLFQLGALLRANPTLAAKGGHIDIPVAGVRGDLPTWSFATLGNELIDTGAGSLETTHLRRSAPADTYDKTIDVWIAVAQGGYPARIMQTEQNGTTYDLTLDKIE